MKTRCKPRGASPEGARPAAFPKARVAAVLAAAALACGGCRKVGLTPVGAGFGLAQASWFEAERTLFFFYEVEAEQGVSAQSTFEVSWSTDDGDTPWRVLESLKQVHRHEKVDCGRKSLCGSGSVDVARKPRRVRMRLRYHREGALALERDAETYLVDARAPHESRSYLVYGVLDERNEAVQWRGRHNFPGIDNLDAERLGLRRYMRITEQRAGTPSEDAEGALDAPATSGGGGPGGPSVFIPTPTPAPTPAAPPAGTPGTAAPTPAPGGAGEPEPEGPTRANPYLYGADLGCDAFAPVTSPALETWKRARFSLAKLPVAARAAAAVCAKATTRDARGEFTTVAWARKNPDTRAAFSTLVSPVASNGQLRYLIAPCRKEISRAHLDMQKQRMFIDGAVDVCLDGLTPAELTDRVAALIGSDVNEERKAGRDMMVVIAFHHEESSRELSTALQTALERVIDAEKSKSSPRLTGAFVFDSDDATTLKAENKRDVLWCPAKKPERPQPGRPPEIPNQSQRACAVQAGSGTLARLGPLQIGALPILPTREAYLDFIDDYGVAQAGRMKKLTFLAPTRTPQTDVVPLREYAQVTFRDGEIVTAAPTDAFSYCRPARESDPYFFRSTAQRSPSPLASLPSSHRFSAAATYELGLGWEFPFLTRLEYESVLSGAATAFGASVPFGIKNSSTAFYGESDWLQTKHPLDRVLVQCTRFCGHPALDSAGVYNARAAWRDFYAGVCHAPAFPRGAPGQEDSPLDP